MHGEKSSDFYVEYFSYSDKALYISKVILIALHWNHIKTNDVLIKIATHNETAKNCRMISFPCKESASSLSRLYRKSSPGSTTNGGLPLLSAMAGKPALCNLAYAALDNAVGKLKTVIRR